MTEMTEKRHVISNLKICWLGFNAKFSKFTIQGSSDVKFPVCLEGIVHSHKQFSSYELEVRHIAECLTHHLLTAAAGSK